MCNVYLKFRQKGFHQIEWLCAGSLTVAVSGEQFECFARLFGSFRTRATIVTVDDDDDAGYGDEMDPISLNLAL